MSEIESIVLEFDGSAPENLNEFTAEISELPGVNALPLASRDLSSAAGILLNLAISAAPLLAESIIKHFKGKALTIEIKRKGRETLKIESSRDDLNRDSLAAVIEDFLDK